MKNKNEKEIIRRRIKKMYVYDVKLKLRGNLSVFLIILKYMNFKYKKVMNMMSYMENKNGEILMLK